MIPVAEPLLGEEELRNVTEAVKSGWISSRGKFIPEFEEEFAKYCGVKHGIAVSNGTAALHLALKALGIDKGSEVIVPDLTFIAPANAVRYCNAKPIFVDSHPDYWCIDPGKIPEAITPTTKAIIPVHLYGHPCDMDPIMEIAKKHNLYVIEDAAEAHGAQYRGRKVGSFGDISCFSFYGNKIMTTGEGGICLTNNEGLAEKMQILRDHGMSPNKKYWHDTIGFNYRMTNLQAAVGIAQLGKIDKFIEKKRKIAKEYSDGLKELNQAKKIQLHPQAKWAKCVYWMYCILVEDNHGVGRDDLIGGLWEKEVDTRPLFYPVHIMPPYDGFSKKDFHVAERLSCSGLSLPSSLNLSTEDVVSVCQIISEIYEHARA